MKDESESMKNTLRKLELFADQAEKALREAVREVIQEHRETGQPLAMTRNDKAMLVPPDQAALPVVAEPHAEYKVRKRARKSRGLRT